MSEYTIHQYVHVCIIIHNYFFFLIIVVVVYYSGNQMGNHGARFLAKVLLTNCHVREVSWDHNDTTLCGLQDVISALKQ